MRLIDADLFMQRIESYNTLDEKDKALYNFALNEIICMPTVDVLDQIRAEIVDLADSDAYGDYQQGFNFGLMRAAQIIDKYMKGDST